MTTGDDGICRFFNIFTVHNRIFFKNGKKDEIIGDTNYEGKHSCRDCSQCKESDIL